VFLDARRRAAYISSYDEISNMIMRDALAITKALADENRVRMLLALQAGELCVCQVIELFGLAASTTSKHLAVLYQAKLVDVRRKGRWSYYAPAGKEAPEGVRGATRWLTKSLAGDPRVCQDAARLKQVLKMDPSELCKKQCGN
jgi:ArsR family transcriptional regulator, arsenate/arsenite/antimonite-responsive transcriptional repressor